MIYVRRYKILHHEVAIIGAGPVGLTLALMLSKQGRQVSIFDAGTVQDGRVLALSYASYEILDSLGVWPSISATPIDIVNISHEGLGIANINCENINLPHLGYTISYNDLCQSLLSEVIQQKNIQVISGVVTNVVSGRYFSSVSYNSVDGIQNISCDLAIVAEGGKIDINNIKYNKFDYQQKAIVAHIKTNKITDYVMAYERFTSDGAMVLLPYKQHYIVVWAVNSGLADSYLQDNLKFIADMDIVFTNRLGGASLLSELYSFPLQLKVAKQRVLPRLVLLGNSAQTVHPVSAQGLNLGLRDVQTLSRVLATQTDLKTSCNLESYDLMRNKDSSFVIGLTHNLVNFLEYKSSFVNHLRGAGIIGLSNIPKLQNILANSLIFGV